jgi:hypothetical protein
MAMVMAKILAGGVGLVALASVAPATAQYYSSVGTQGAANRCAAAVDSRRNLRVVSVTSVVPRRNFVHVRGIATTGGYGPYGVGAYGMLGSNYRANVSFSCDVDYRGRVRDIDINRR